MSDAVPQLPVENSGFTAPNGPFIATGDLQIDLGAAGVVSQPKASLCRCGASAKKPFCDGSHRTAGFVDAGEAAAGVNVAELTETGPVVFSCVPNGPLVAKGPLIVRNAAKEAISAGTEAYLCRCGASANKPYCDGSHSRVGFQG